MDEKTILDLYRDDSPLGGEIRIRPREVDMALPRRKTSPHHYNRILLPDSSSED